MVRVRGGGQTGQAQAVRHGIARALQAWDPAMRPALKVEGGCGSGWGLAGWLAGWMDGWMDGWLA